jgi:hypothetical protein
LPSLAWRHGQVGDPHAPCRNGPRRRCDRLRAQWRPAAARHHQRGRLRQRRERRARVRGALQRHGLSCRFEQLRGRLRERSGRVRVPACRLGGELSCSGSVPRRYGSGGAAGSGRAHRALSGGGEPDPERRARRPRVDRRRNLDRRRRAVVRGRDHVGSPRRLPRAGQPRRGEPDCCRGLERRRRLDGSRAERLGHGRRCDGLGLRQCSDTGEDQCRPFGDSRGSGHP